MYSYAQALRDNRARIGVWGLGTIGYSTLAYFAGAGIKGVGYDIDPVRVAEVNHANVNIPGMAEWLDEDCVTLTESGYIAATNELNEMLMDDVLVHFLAIPTERSGMPCADVVRDVIDKLACAVTTKSDYCPLVIVESTLTPGTTEQVIIPCLDSHGIQLDKDLMLCLSPRRDWFHDGGYALRNLDRIYGANSEASADAALAVLGLVCDRLHRASSCRIVELTKVVENSYRFVGIALANELSIAYRSADIIEVLRLAGTKWNMETYVPSFGAGGHCVPVAPRHLIVGTEVPDALPLLTAALSSEDRMPRLVAQIAKMHGCRRALVLGLSYRAQLKVSIFSPTIPLVRWLLNEQIAVEVCDPFYELTEIEDQTGALATELPPDFSRFDAIFLCTDHKAFTTADVHNAILHRDPPAVIVDNHGAWHEWDWPRGVYYYRVGDGSWLQ